MAVVRSRPQRTDRGASAVEFALVTPLLLVMLFGIIDYGIWFADSISARQAVRNVARQGAVGQFGTCGSTPAPNPLQNLACTLKSNMDQISGSSAVRITVAKTPGGAGDQSWQQGYTLRVCAITQHQALLPMVPFPNDGVSRTVVNMPIEVGTVTGTVATVTDAPLGGTTWAPWCP